MWNVSVGDFFIRLWAPNEWFWLIFMRNDLLGCKMKIAMLWRELTIGGSYKNFGEGDIFPGGEMNKILAGERDAPKASTPHPIYP